MQEIFMAGGRKKTLPIKGDTRLLMRFDNSWADECGGVVTATASFNTSIKKFGTASAAFPSGRAVTVTANNARYVTGITEATLECWMYKNANASWSAGIGQGTSTSNGQGWCFSPSDGGDMVTICRSPTNVATVGILVSTGVIPNNAWSHVAMTWKDGIATGFVNGKKQLSAPMPYWFLRESMNFDVGYLPYTRTRLFPGLMDELRFSANAIYSGDFDPPTSPFEL